MTTTAETAGNGSEAAEVKATDKTDKVVTIAQAFGIGERVLDEVEAIRSASSEDQDASNNVGEVHDVHGLFDEHVRMSPFVSVNGQELALRDHMRNGKPATAILELLSKNEDGEEQLVGTLGASKVWTTDPETKKHVLIAEAEGVPLEFAPIIATVAEAVHERIEAQQQLADAA
jgi:hypothetical protein